MPFRPIVKFFDVLIQNSFNASREVVILPSNSINQCIAIILTTRKGSVPLRPTFGSEIYKYVDYPVNEAIPNITRETIDSVYGYNVKAMTNGYKMFKKFISIHYPSIEIISVNPVGLKGIFKDVYTQKYVDEHPELRKENIEIIKKGT